MKALLAVLATLAALALVACGGDDDGGGTPTPTIPSFDVGGLTVQSRVFEDGGEIPVTYTCDGEDESLPLYWGGAPEGTMASVVVVDDPDANGFVHWVFYDFPSPFFSFEAQPDTPRLNSGAANGTNSFGDVGYGGPCPPKGQTHTYRIRVYSIDEPTGLEPGATWNEVAQAIAGHVLASGELTGTYGR